MAIYFKSRGIWVQHVPNWLSKTRQIRSFFIIEPKYITSWVILDNLFVLYVVHHNSVTESPHDHLFQKSRHFD